MTDASAATAALLGFTPAWFALGIVDDATLAEAQARWDTGADPHTEHYRYYAFRQFLTRRRPLDPATLTALYELGAADADGLMGGAIMSDVVWQPECPEAVLALARASGRRHLVRAVEQRRGPAGGER